MQGLPALFNFDMGGAITKAVNTEQADSLVINHKKIRDFYASINPDYVDATFLTNHDQNRIMSAVNNNVNKAKMAAALLLTLPGSPYLYYGEEIGMQGKKPDQYIREPFIWDTKAKDNMRASWIAPRFSSDSSVVPAAQQVNEKGSMYNHYKRFIQLRNSSKALTYGELGLADLERKALCAFTRATDKESVLVVHNLSGSNVNVALPPHLKAFSRIVFKNKDANFKNNQLTIPAYSSLVLGR
jgi:glycosidase